MSEGELKYNPETESQLEPLTGEGVTEMFKNRDFSRIDRLERFAAGLEEMASEISLLNRAFWGLGTMRIEGSPDTGMSERAATEIAGRLKAIEDEINRIAPGGKFVF